MKHRLLLSIALLGLLAGSAHAGTLSDARYRLFYLHPVNGPVRVHSTDPLPAGSNVAPDNQWRYDYFVLNKAASPLNAFYAFFNSDNVQRALHVSGSAPADWTVLKQGPIAPNVNYKIRYRTTVQASKIPTDGELTCSETFTWTGETVPGPQNYDAVNDGGSESGVTVEIVDTVGTADASTWGRIKALYR
jgi:hypothetical protein